MVRRVLIVLALASYAYGQSAPDAEEAEKALRQRVEEFYQLQQDKKFRQAEDYVAPESKDDYYNARKQEVRDFHIEKIVLEEGNTKAHVTIKGRMIVLFAGAQEFVMPAESTWKIEDGKWFWYLDPVMKNLTPFGMMTMKEKDGLPDIKGLDMTGKAPDLNEILKKIAIDRTLVEFDKEQRVFAVTITNGTPGLLTLTLDPHVAMIKGLEATLDKAKLDAGEKSTVTLKWTGSQPFDDLVYIRVDPYLTGFNVRVTAK